MVRITPLISIVHLDKLLNLCPNIQTVEWRNQHYEEIQIPLKVFQIVKNIPVFALSRLTIQTIRYLSIESTCISDLIFITKEVIPRDLELKTFVYNGFINKNALLHLQTCYIPKIILLIKGLTDTDSIEDCLNSMNCNELICTYRQKYWMSCTNHSLFNFKEMKPYHPMIYELKNDTRPLLPLPNFYQQLVVKTQSLNQCCNLTHLKSITSIKMLDQTKKSKFIFPTTLVNLTLQCPCSFQTSQLPFLFEIKIERCLLTNCICQLKLQRIHLFKCCSNQFINHLQVKELVIENHLIPLDFNMLPLSLTKLSLTKTSSKGRCNLRKIYLKELIIGYKTKFNGDVLLPRTLVSLQCKEQNCFPYLICNKSNVIEVNGKRMLFDDISTKHISPKQSVLKKLFNSLFK
ncbi:hypothetical protein QTN25_004165 [Entamoeba marina]